MFFSKLPAPIGKPPETHYIFTTLNRFFMLLSRFPPRFAFWILCLLVFVIIQTVDRIALMGWVSVTHPDSFPLLLLTLPVPPLALLMCASVLVCALPRAVLSLLLCVLSAPT